MTPSRLHLVPHTHWDREWYEPHDVFRVRLVAMVDGLLDLLESDPGYRFTLDGQAAAVDDYLALRPENAGRVAAAVERGQLAIGPFLILLDEFCGDGETIVRNLELGIRSSRGVASEMRVGYLPDMFGHAAQMPQILVGFGIRDAALWRGVPSGIRRHAFRWTAPNGDWVRTENLWDGYGSALKLFEPLSKAAALIEDYLDQNAEWFDGEDVAGMYGTDHMLPRADLGEVVRATALATDRLGEMLTLGELVARRDHSEAALAALPETTGELRSHARGNLLPGVLSVRTNLKAAMAESERRLATAERLDAVAGDGDIRAFLDRAWYRLVESTAHDSATGCGVDETAEQVETRIHEAGHIARGLIDQRMRALSRLAPRGTVLAFNQAGRSRVVQVELTLDGDEAPQGTQLLEHLPTTIGDEVLAPGDLEKVIRRIHGQELFGRQIRSYAWVDHGLDFVVADEADGTFDLAAFTSELRARAATGDPAPWRVRTLVPPSVRVLAESTAPGLGLVVVDPATAALGDRPVTVDGHTLSNGLVEVEVRVDGAINVVHLASGRRSEGACVLVDDGDCGDSYNFGPVPDGTVDGQGQVTITVAESGPLRARIVVTRRLLLPARLGADRASRSPEVVEQLVVTTYELRTGDDFCRVTVELVNRAADHRLRLLVPTRESDVATSASAGQYGVTVRGRTAEGGWGEFPLPTFPGTRFVHAGGVAVLLRRVTEFEVVEGQGGGPDAIALTLVRSVGMMSVNTHPLRDEPAGSEIPVPGAQYLGTTVRVELALSPAWAEWDAPELMAAADVFRFEPVAVSGSGDGVGEIPLPPLQAPGDVVLESLRRLPDGLEARFVNYAPAPRTLAVTTDRPWRRTDLAGEVLDDDVDPTLLSVPVSTIVTLRSAH